MKRRPRGSSILRSIFVLLVLLAVPLAVGAQPAGTVHRIGILENRSIQLSSVNIDALREGLRQLGHPHEDRQGSRRHGLVVTTSPSR